MQNTGKSIHFLNGSAFFANGRKKLPLNYSVKRPWRIIKVVMSLHLQRQIKGKHHFIIAIGIVKSANMQETRRFRTTEIKSNRNKVLLRLFDCKDAVHFQICWMVLLSLHLILISIICCGVGHCTLRWQWKDFLLRHEENDVSLKADVSAGHN